MEAEELLKDVLAVTRDAAFNRVRYISAMMSQEEQAEFLKGLFNQAVLAREARSGDALFDYLEQWEEKGMAIVAGRAQSPIELDATPWTPVAVTSASTVPPPPSATGMTATSELGAARSTPRRMASDASAADAVPLNACGATTILIAPHYWN